MINYEPLEHTLISRKKKRKDLINDLGISTRTIAKITKQEYISLEIIDRLCNYLDCQIEDIVQYIKDTE